jgi:C4-dicarboxylate-specific signal transduction histidine kinase
VVERVHADDRPAFRDRLSQAARRRGDYQSEFRLALPDGPVRWIAALGRVEYDADGTALCSRGACIDITANKQAEQEMLRLRQEIAHVGRVSVMGQLSSALAHEINQPLGAILRNAEAAALFLQHPSPDLHEIAAILEDIRKDDQRASEVIVRIRALLRREDVAMTALNMRGVLGDVAMLLRPDAAARHVSLQVGVPADLPAVRGDQVQVQQVLLNLVLNGMDALEGVVDRARSVVVTARRDGSASVEVSVADSGRGIDLDQLDRIFDPFFTTKPKGIGMGLSISRGIIETHGGRLWAEANAAGGATFRFTLPVAGEAAHEPGPGRTSTKGALSGAGLRR